LKTGYFQAAGFSIAATASKNGVRIIALVLGSKERKVRDAKAVELLHKGFTLAPAPLELRETAAPSPPGSEGLPLPSTATTEAAPVQVAVPGAATTEVSATASPTPPPASAPPATSRGWSTFFIGLGLGFLLFLGLFVVAGFLMNKRSKGRQKNLRRL
jgi:serine-type D-Ala-D-Ala carboxypeptidase (penicillin-binding protein 5/6)